jgi:hypothetical protein
MFVVKTIVIIVCHQWLKKQSMKLYTEEQVVNALNKVFIESITFEDVNEVMRGLTPIELPSDEEIEQETLKTHTYIFCNGAKWMRDKIQGGNNEQQ